MGIFDKSREGHDYFEPNRRHISNAIRVCVFNEASHLTLCRKFSLDF